MNSPPIKLRLMCSNGGHIVPRPHDKTLRYIGGETRIVSVDRHTTTLNNLKNILSKTLNPPTTSFCLKYQLPLQDLDSLISLTTDEDLENMFQEFDRLLLLSKNNNLCSSSSSSRIRLFIFQNNPDPVSGLSLSGSGFESLTKSDDWFVNALNGAATSSLFSDNSSNLVNSLLNLDDGNDDDEKLVKCKSVTGNGSGQDVNSVPGSPMMETTFSSFGSGSSNPSIVNLRPIKVKGNSDVGSPVKQANSEQSDPFLFYQERVEQKFQQKQFSGFDLPSTDLPRIRVSSDSTITEQLSRVHVQSPSNNNQVGPNTPNQNTRVQIIQQQNSPHLHHHQQMQYIQSPQFTTNHHPAPPPSYYQQYPQQPPTNQQNVVYYVPTRESPRLYNFPLQQAPGTKATFPSNGYIATPNSPSPSPRLVRVLSGGQYQPQYVGYSEMNHPQYTQER